MSDNLESPSQQQPDPNDLETDQGGTPSRTPLSASADNSSPLTSRNLPLPGRVETQPDGHNLMLLSLCSPPERHNWPYLPPARTHYRYMSEGGRGITVYVIDGPVDIKHETHSHPQAGSRRWLFDYSSSNPNGHATCILDVIAGLNHGVAKFADIVFCSDQPREGEDAEVTTKHEHYNRIFKLIADDIESRGLQGKAVVCHAGVITDDTGPDGESYLLERLQLIRNICDLGVLIVVAGVSERVWEDEPDVDRQPQDYADRLPILVVDPVDGDGKLYDSRDPESILVAWGHAPALALAGTVDQYEAQLGSSFATAAVAGLVAGMLSETSTIEALQHLVIEDVLKYLIDYLTTIARKPWPECEVEIAWSGLDWQGDEYVSTTPLRRRLRFGMWLPKKLGLN